MLTSPTFRCDAILGEGASWDAERSRLWWVDIIGRRLFCGNPVDGTAKSWEIETEIGAAPGLSDGRRALVLRNRVELFDPETGKRTLFWHCDEPASNRFNDAGVDPWGNLWIGSMDEAARDPTGALWRIDLHGRARRVLGGVRVVNGPVFSPDGGVLYLADTMAGQVLAFDHDSVEGVLFERRVIINLGPSGGLADGMAVDVEGCLWLARITSGRVTRYSPHGEPLLTIPVSVPMVTSVAFGGPDLNTLFMTTARILMDPTDLRAYPDSGCVYSVKVPVPGLPVARMGAFID